MKDKPTLLVAGRDKPQLQAIESSLRGRPDLQVQIRPIDNGHADPLYGLRTLPDILLLVLSDAWQEELRALRSRPLEERPPLIALGPAGNIQVMRKAMQAGARDFFTQPVPPEELLASVSQVAKDLQMRTAKEKGRLTVVINATNGSGATFLACNLAHMLAIQGKLKVAVIDMDLQFGNLPLYLDMSLRHGLPEVLAEINQLDVVALEGYMGKHVSGLHVLASSCDQVLLPWEIAEKDLNRLLEIALQAYEHLVVDLSRQIDSLTSTILEQADHVLIVMQESLTSIRDAKRLLQILQRDLALLDERISVVVNRHQDKNPVSLADLREALKISTFLLIPNDFKRATEAINTGVPLLDSDKHAAITKAIREMAVKLSGKSHSQPSRGRLHRALSHFLPLT